MAVIKKTQKVPLEDDILSGNVYYKSTSDIYRQAESLGIKTSPFDIESFIKRHGIRIFREEMDIDTSGYIEKRLESIVIGVNRYQNSRRQRFTLAHEFAHYLLHREIVLSGRHEDQILLRSEEWNPREGEANDFASKILMPKSLFEHHVQSGIRKLEDLADIFDVSLAAVRYRAFKLGYIKSF